VHFEGAVKKSIRQDFEVKGDGAISGKSAQLG
jgi:hypothetical protein